MNLFSSIGFLRSVFVVIFATGILFSSCVNDLDTIEKVTYDPSAPDEVTENLELIYTDSGYTELKLVAKIAETYMTPQHITKLKNGFQVDFYQGENKVSSTLTAQYGEINYATGIVTVRDSVVLKNHKKKRQLETETLYWNQNDSTIYTDKNVIVRTEGKGITGRGKGIKTTQDFSRYTILEPVGKFDLDED